MIKYHGLDQGLLVIQFWSIVKKVLSNFHGILYEDSSDFMDIQYKMEKTKDGLTKKNRKEFFDIVRLTIYADDFYGQNYKKKIIFF